MKKILYIGDKFYGYENEIIEEFSKYGKVFPIFTNIDKKHLIICKILSSIFLSKKAKEYLELIKIKNISNQLESLNLVKIDILFCIPNGYTSKEQLNFIKSKIFKIDKKILYFWDTLNKFKKIDYCSFFDEIYSFDMRECKENDFIFKPTFYSKRLKKESNYLYDIVFIAEYSMERAKIIKDILNLKLREDITKFIYLYKNFLEFFYIFFKNVKILKDLKYIKFKRIKKEKYNEIINSSQILIDIVPQNQQGLTQRVLDSLYLEKKIITNNKAIKEYDFYDENNILLIDNEAYHIEKFFKTKYKKISKKIIKKYSIQEWIKDFI